MREHKTKKERLTVYMMKDSALRDEQIIKTDRTKPGVELKIPDGSAWLYVKNIERLTPPAWAPFLTVNQDVPPKLFAGSRAEGAVLIVRLAASTFTLTFGMGHHLLNLDLVERDFGLRVTLNSIDAGRLRSLDKAGNEANPLNTRSQTTRDADIFDLHVDTELDMVNAVTGASNVPLFGEHVTGRDALAIMPEATLDDVPAILMEAVTRHKLPLSEKFEWIDNVSRVRDPVLLACLDDDLNQALAVDDGGANIWLGEPEIVDWEAQLGYSFDQRARLEVDTTLRLERLLSHLDKHGKERSVEGIKSQCIYVNDVNFQKIKEWNAFRCLYAELPIGKRTYVLRKGYWYEVNRDFIDQIDAYLSNIEIDASPLPIYKHRDEGCYNKEAALAAKNIELLDRKLIRIGGPFDKVEFCDLVRDGRDLIHVKCYRNSATLSHLFSQGSVSAEAFAKHAKFRIDLNDKLPASIKLRDPSVRPDLQNYRVVFAIATVKTLPQELPFFSKIALKNAMITVKGFGYGGVAISRIEVDPDFQCTTHCRSDKKVIAALTEPLEPARGRRPEPQPPLVQV
jgi:uncharacterized protein (TIGR04141 family)